MIKTFTQQINESKDHIINKLPLLSREQKDEVIAFFNRKPNLERKIDWNKGLKLAWDDFVDVMKEVSKTERKKAVREHGIAGLKEGKDYIELHFREHYDESNYQAYIPLHWEASKLIASNKIGGCEGEWCISYQKDISYWKSYTQKKKQLPVFIIGNNAKWSVMVHENDRDFDVWDQYDAQQDDDDIPGLDIYKQVIKPNAHLFDKIREEHFKYKHFIESAVVRDNKYKIDEHGFLIWYEGTWVSGLWEDGHWISGTWNNGTWNKGEWEDGHWWNGTYKEGHWHNGVWHNGVWEDGLWEKGEWLNGDWIDGTWYDGTWRKGTWNNGTWKKGKWYDGEWHSGAFIEGVWHNGVWRDGMWMDGEWMNGVWKNGSWKWGTWGKGVWWNGVWWNGEWRDGEWNGGEWNEGVWKNGDWIDGLWKDGVWENGRWHNGTWRKGIWNGGVWMNGEWLNGSWNGGRDWRGVWHDQGDSPDKWKM